MSWILTLRPRAREDLRRAHAWYEERCAGLGDEFLSELSAALLRLEADPERFPLSYRGFRRVLAHRFPYRVFFRISGQNPIVF